MKIIDIANSILLELGDTSQDTLATISFWLRNNLGQLNTYLDLEACIDSNNQEIILRDPITGIIKQDLCPDEIAIYKLLFYINWYGKQIRNNSSGAAAYDWSTLQEGDSVIRKVTRNDVSKTLLAEQKDTKDTLEKLVGYFRMNKARPSSVTGDDTQEGGNILRGSNTNQPFWRTVWEIYPLQ